MESLLMLVLLAGGGLFAYRQWKALQAESAPCLIENPPAKAERIERGETPIYGTWIMPEAVEPLHADERSPPTKAKPRINKWLLFGLALAYLICPLDGDFVPLVGWLDDAVVMAMGIRALMDKSR
jgi:Protein of unknown function (DUF1232)